MELKLSDSAQSLPIVVTVKRSLDDRITELYAAYVRPLEAEIIERLGQLDGNLVDKEILNPPFSILTPKKFVENVYKASDVPWMQGLLEAAYREQWPNFELLSKIILLL